MTALAAVALGRPLDPPFQPADLRRQFTVGRVAQKRVDAALVFDRPDRRGRDAQADWPHSVRKDRNPLQVRQKTAGSYSAAINSLFSNQADSIAAKLSPKLKETVHEQIILEVQRITAPAAGKPFFLVALFIPRFVDIKQENDHAVVNVKAEQIQLTMNAAEARWRVVAIRDDKLSQLVADGIKKNLSTSGTQLQDEIRKQLEKIQPTR